MAPRVLQIDSSDDDDDDDDGRRARDPASAVPPSPARPRPRPSAGAIRATRLRLSQGPASQSPSPEKTARVGVGASANPSTMMTKVEKVADDARDTSNSQRRQSVIIVLSDDSSEDDARRRTQPPPKLQMGSQPSVITLSDSDDDDVAPLATSAAPPVTERPSAPSNTSLNTQHSARGPEVAPEPESNALIPTSQSVAASSNAAEPVSYLDGVPRIARKRTLVRKRGSTSSAAADASEDTLSVAAQRPATASPVAAESWQPMAPHPSIGLDSSVKDAPGPMGRDEEPMDSSTSAPAPELQSMVSRPGQIVRQSASFPSAQTPADNLQQEISRQPPPSQSASGDAVMSEHPSTSETRPALTGLDSTLSLERALPTAAPASAATPSAASKNNESFAATPPTSNGTRPQSTARKSAFVPRPVQPPPTTERQASSHDIGFDVDVDVDMLSSDDMTLVDSGRVSRYSAEEKGKGRAAPVNEEAAPQPKSAPGPAGRLRVVLEEDANLARQLAMSLAAPPMAAAATPPPPSPPSGRSRMTARKSTWTSAAPPPVASQIDVDDPAQPVNTSQSPSTSRRKQTARKSTFSGFAPAILDADQSRGQTPRKSAFSGLGTKNDAAPSQHETTSTTAPQPSPAATLKRPIARKSSYGKSPYYVTAEDLANDAKDVTVSSSVTPPANSVSAAQPFDQGMKRAVARKSGLRASLTANDLTNLGASSSRNLLGRGRIGKGPRVTIVDLTLSSDSESESDDDEENDDIEVVQTVAAQQDYISAQTSAAIGEAAAAAAVVEKERRSASPPASDVAMPDVETRDATVDRATTTPAVEHHAKPRDDATRPQGHVDTPASSVVPDSVIGTPGPARQTSTVSPALEPESGPERRRNPKRMTALEKQQQEALAAVKGQEGAVGIVKPTLEAADEPEQSEDEVEEEEDVEVLQQKWTSRQRDTRPISARCITGPSFGTQDEFYEQIAIISDRQRAARKHQKISPNSIDYKKHDAALYENMIAEVLAAEVPCAPQDLPRIRICGPVGGGPPYTPPFEYVYTNRVVYDNGIVPKRPPGCKCEGNCATSPRCACKKRQKVSSRSKPNQRKRSGIKGFAYSSKGVAWGNVIDAQEPIWECNSSCECGPECVNRVTGQIPRASVDIFFANELKGWGTRNPRSYDYVDLDGQVRHFKERVLPKGTPLGIYAAELLKSDDAWRREEDVYRSIGRNYLYELDQHTIAEDRHELERQAYKARKRQGQAAAAEIEDSRQADFALDAMCFGNWTRFCNHSCSKFNARVQPVYIDDADLRRPVYVFFATRDILPGDEIAITYYGEEPRIPDGWTLEEWRAQQKENFREAPPEWACYCGEELCRGIMFDYDEDMDA